MRRVKRQKNSKAQVQCAISSCQLKNSIHKIGTQRNDDRGDCMRVGSLHVLCFVIMLLGFHRILLERRNNILLSASAYVIYIYIA